MVTTQLTPKSTPPLPAKPPKEYPLSAKQEVTPIAVRQEAPSDLPPLLPPDEGEMNWFPSDSPPPEHKMPHTATATIPEEDDRGTSPSATASNFGPVPQKAFLPQSEGSVQHNPRPAWPLP